MFFDNWSVLERTVIVGALAYVGLVLFLRVSGKRTLSKWNAFDFIVTIALGSSLASTILSKDITLAQGLAGFGVLIGFQYVVTWLSVRVKGLHDAINNRPTLLLYRGRVLEDAMRRERVTRADLYAALRGHGYAAYDGLGAVVLETDGSFSVLADLPEGRASTLDDVAGFSG